MSETVPNFGRLQDALAVLSSALGTSATAESIANGLPLEQGRLSQIHLTDAATRGGLALTSAVGRQLKPHDCPLLFCNTRNDALIIAEISKDGTALTLSETGATKSIKLDALARAGFTSCWLVVPAQPHDQRTMEGPEDHRRHWILEALWMDRSILSSVIAATVFTNVLALVVPLVMMNVMDRVVAHAAFATLWALTIGAIAAIALDFILRTLRGSLIDKASAAGDVVVNNRIFSKLLGTKLSARQGSVGVQSNTLREFDSLREISNSATLATLGDLPFAILFLAVIGMVSGWLVVVPLAMVPVLLLLGYFTQRKLNALVASHYKDTAYKNAVAVEVLLNMETIKAHVGESWAAAKWERSVASYLRHSIGMRWWMAFSANTMMAAQSATTIAILVMGVYLISAGQMSGGALFAAIMLTGRALTPIAQLSALIAKFHHARTAFKSIKNMVDAEQDRPDEARFLRPPNQINSIVLDNVSLTYRKDGQPALKNITLEIAAGERIGIIGAIGSGKSTLLRVLTGLRSPTSGTIAVDGIPAQQIDPVLYRRKFGVQFRESGFFFGTLRENISFHRPNNSDEDVVEAARMGGALDWINALPKAFDTQIGESGAGLSSGQRQTISLARAFLGQPQILVLDEPTSDLDTRSESQLVQRLVLMPRSKTLIAVTHRPAVIEACTRLIVIDNGAIIMDGSKDMVLAEMQGKLKQQKMTKAA
jgi:ATP-binding cassette, subfamily C, bacterial LapB